MSVQAMTWVLEQVRGFTPSERLVLLSIANHADAQGDNAWPSKKTLAREADVSEDTVDKVVGRLQDAGILQVAVQQGGDHRVPAHRRPNRYRLVYAVTTAPPGWRTHGGDRTGQVAHRGGQDAPPGKMPPGPQDAPEAGGQHAPPTGGATCPPKPSSVTVHEPPPRVASRNGVAPEQNQVPGGVRYPIGSFAAAEQAYRASRQG